MPSRSVVWYVPAFWYLSLLLLRIKAQPIILRLRERASKSLQNLAIAAETPSAGLTSPKEEKEDKA